MKQIYYGTYALLINIILQTLAIFWDCPFKLLV